MKYDFDKIINRNDTNSLKWDLFNVELSMWVADMDFQTAPEITEKLASKIASGVYGYSIVSDEWYESYIQWWKKHHNFKIKKEELSFTAGVIPAISTIIRQLTNKGDKILIQSPVYHVFYNVINNNKREVLENQLIYKNNSYKIDFDDLEEKLNDSKTKMMILCNPHNPIGEIWSEKDLKRISKLCRKYDVYVIADEIHCDLINPNEDFIPFASVDKNSITCISPSKTFNLAGFQSAAVIVQNSELKKEIDQAILRDSIGSPNFLAIDSTVIAFKYGEKWLEELNIYLYENKLFLDNFLKSEIPDVYLVPSKATYLLWLDISNITLDSDEFTEFLKNEAGLAVSSGNDFGSGGEGFIRINIACPRKLLEDGLNRLKEAIYKYDK